MILKLFRFNQSIGKRVVALWVIRYLYRFSFVIGWTLIVSLFVSRYQIFALPYLFVINALLIMLGSAFFSAFFSKVKKSVALIITIFAIGVVLFAAVASFENSIVFFGLLFFAEAFLMYQLNLILENFLESLFSYTESEKVFSFLESADTFGGITAGVLIFTLSNLIETHKFIYLWLASLFLMVPIFLSFKGLQTELNYYRSATDEPVEGNRFEGLSSFLSKISSNDFYKILIGLVFLYWLAINLVEYLFTSAVYESVQQLVPTEGSGFEHALVHDFGSLNVLFYGSLLLVQSLMGGKLISKLGVVGSMIIYPLIMLVSAFSLLFNFSFLTAVLTKNNMLISGVIFKNAYLSSYYAIKEDLRANMREFLEGFVHPLGAITATAILIAAQFALSTSVIIVINFVLILVLLSTFYLLRHLRRAYLKMATIELEGDANEHEKSAAIEIVAQEGMKRGANYLLSKLKSDSVPVKMKVTILKVLSQKRGRIDIFPYILDVLETQDKFVQHEVLQVLLSLPDLSSSSPENLFSNYRLTESLRKIFVSNVSFKVQATVLDILLKLPHFNVVEFLLTSLKSCKNHDVLAGCITLCRRFKDPSLLMYIKKLATHKSPLIRYHAMLINWDFPDLDNNKEAHEVAKSLRGRSNVLKKHALLALLSSHVDAIQHFESEVVSLIGSNNLELRFLAAICLARLGKQIGVDAIVRDILSIDAHLMDTLTENLVFFESKMRRLFVNEMRLKTDQCISELFGHYKSSKSKAVESATRQIKSLLLLVQNEREAEEVMKVVEESLKKRYAI